MKISIHEMSIFQELEFTLITEVAEEDIERRL